MGVGPGSPHDPEVMAATGAWLESRIEVEPEPQGGSRAWPMTVLKLL